MIYCLWNKVEKKSDCKNLELITENNVKYCCYVEYNYKEEKFKECAPLTQEEYDDINKYKDDFNQTWKTELKKIDCNSFYLKASFLSLLIFFL